MSRVVAAFAFIALNFYIYQYLASEEVVPPRETFETLPLELGDWSCPGREEMEPKALRILGTTDYLLCTWWERDTREPVALYVGYHESQVRPGGGGGETVIHPPEHCLPGAGWGIVDSSRRPIAFDGLPPLHGLRDEIAMAKRFVIAKGDERQLVYFWYQGQGRVVTANEDVILFRFWNRATRGRTDGALVRFTTPIVQGDIEGAEARFQRFARELVPQLASRIPD